MANVRCKFCYNGREISILAENATRRTLAQIFGVSIKFFIRNKLKFAISFSYDENKYRYLCRQYVFILTWIKNCFI